LIILYYDQQMDQKKIDVIGQKIDEQLTKYIDDPDDKKTLIDFVVQSINGVRLDYAVLIYGSGCNGKSLFLRWLMDLLDENQITTRQIALRVDDPISKESKIDVLFEYSKGKFAVLESILESDDHPNILMEGRKCQPDNKRLVQIQFSKEIY
jgi:hypothetical protein